MNAQTHMAIDQNGQTFHDLGPHPRKALLERLGRKRASRMFRDVHSKDGTRSVHVGYVIGGHWLTLFKVERWEKPDG